MGELTEIIEKTDLQAKIEAGDIQIIQIGNLEFLATKQGVGFLEGCKRQAEMKVAWDAERRKNFTESGKPRKDILPWKRSRPLSQ
jgi:hypothetical protein